MITCLNQSIHAQDNCVQQDQQDDQTLKLVGKSELINILMDQLNNPPQVSHVDNVVKLTIVQAFHYFPFVTLR